MCTPIRVVSSDLLIDEVWGGSPPQTAANALQVYVNGLRGVLEPERPRRAASRVLPGHAGGYSLIVEPEALDADRFERETEAAKNALQRGEAAAAAEVMRQALGIWRGSALADFTYAPFAQAEIARLEELRLAALEERIEADLVLGREAALIAELEGLVAANPLREQFRGQLMVCLYRSGRQAEALEAYAQIHAAMVDELGIPPAPPLQDLQHSILNHDPKLESRGSPPHPHPGSQRPRWRTRPRQRARRPPPGSHKTVTVLVIERYAGAGGDPDAPRGIDGHDLDATQAVVERHGGSIESVLGNRMMAVFGVPLAHEDDAIRALRASAELARRSPAGETGSLPPRIGIAAGEILPGGPLPISAEGPVMVASDLVEAASAGEVLVSEQIHELLRGAGRFEPVQGAPGSRRLIELTVQPGPLSGPSAVPIIGREGELLQLLQSLQDVANERAIHLVTVLGAAGIGKSRLVQELASRVAGEATVVAGRCLPYGDGITFWPLREMVEQLTSSSLSGRSLGRATRPGAWPKPSARPWCRARAQAAARKYF